MRVEFTRMCSKVFVTMNLRQFVLYHLAASSVNWIRHKERAPFIGFFLFPGTAFDVLLQKKHSFSILLDLNLCEMVLDFLEVISASGKNFTLTKQRNSNLSVKKVLIRCENSSIGCLMGKVGKAAFRGVSGIVS